MNAIEKFEANASFSRNLKITPELMDVFGKISQDFNPLHTKEIFAQEKGFKGCVAYGNLLGLMISALVGMDLPTQEVMLISQKTMYRAPVFVNDSIQLNAEVSSVSEAVGVVELKLKFTNQDNLLVATGSCQLKVL